MTAAEVVVSRVEIAVIGRVGSVRRGFFEKQEGSGRRCRRGAGNACMKTLRLSFPTYSPDRGIEYSLLEAILVWGEARGGEHSLSAL